MGLVGLEGWCAVAKVPSYSLEFRRRAVELLESSGKSAPVLVRELGVSPQTLRSEILKEAAAFFAREGETW